MDPASDTPETYIRRFAALWGARDGTGLALMMAEDADVLSLSGLFCEGREAIAEAFRAEFAGTFARARLVTGRTKLRPLGPGACILHQRFVLSGLTDAAGRDLGRIGALLTAVLVARAGGWHAASLTFAGMDG